MNLLPYERHSYPTSLSLEEIQTRLALDIERLKVWRLFNRTDKKFEGNLDAYGFKVWTITKRRNSFLPIITGKIKEEGNLRIVHLKMRLHWFISLLLIFSVIFLIYTAGNSFEHMILYCLAVYGMMIFGFKSESSKVKDYFEYLIEARKDNA